MIKQPMLAGKVEDIDKLKFPVLVTPKIDGIRTITTPTGPVSRTFKPVPNLHIRKLLSALPQWLDGEAIIPEAEFNEVSGAWRNELGEPNFIYMIFDYVRDGNEVPYHERMQDLQKLCLAQKGHTFVTLLLPEIVNNREELLIAEEAYLASGYEGLMLRSPDGPYKFGRSTFKEGYLLKLKRFNDCEAVVVGFEELMHNENPKEEDAFGRSKRSGHSENKTGTNRLGSLICRGLNEWKGVEFNIGTGFDQKTREEIWQRKNLYEGLHVSFTYQKGTEITDRPRFPVFRGFRAKEDI